MFKKTILGTSLALSFIIPFTPSNVYATASSSSIKNAVSDTVITGKIKALYSKSNALKGQKLSVTTINHRVALDGVVKTNSQYERAIILAQSVDGVKRVNVDNLLVKSSNEPMADAFITAKVKSKFFNEKLFGSKDIQVWPVKVETKDAVVYLSGTVSTAAERNNAVALAHKVKGVKSVKSSIILG